MRIAAVLQNPKSGEYFTGNVSKMWSAEPNDALRIDSMLKIREMIGNIRKIRERVDNSFDGIKTVKICFMIFTEDQRQDFRFTP